MVCLDILAIIPARRGSKRLAMKNTLPLKGKPLIQWTIDAAIDSGVIDLIVVTSDDEKVLSIAKENKIETISRPANLATDSASTYDVIIHALDVLKKKDIVTKRIMLLQPTSPLRTASDIRNSVRKMDDWGYNSIISVCEAEHSPLWSNVIDEDGRMDNFLPKDLINIRSQDLKKYYRLNGALYLAHTILYRKNSGFFMEKSCAYIMPQERSVDIDSKLDFILCNAILEAGLIGDDIS